MTKVTKMSYGKTVEPDQGQAASPNRPMSDSAARSLALAEAEMADGERLIWADMSSPSGSRRRVLPLSVLGWLLLLLAFVWMMKAASASLSLLMLGLPFLLAALLLAVLPWFWPLVTRYTVYAMSDRRLLIIQTWPRRRVTSYGPDDIDVVERRDYRDGTGDIIFRHEEHGKRRDQPHPRAKRRVSDRPIGFLGVPDARRVEMAIWALKERRTVPPFGENLPSRE